MADIIKKDDLNKKNPLGTTQPVRPAGQGSGPQGTGFTNIQKIIGANQGNKLGSAVAGGVQQTGQKVQQNLDQSKQQFNTKVAANSLNNDQTRQAATGIIDSASNLAGGQTLTDEQMAQGQKFAEGAYTGPNDIQNSQQLIGQAVDAEQMGRLAGTSEGRQGLLQRFVGAPQYNLGQQKLDSLLLGADRKALAASRDAVRGLAEQSANEIGAARGLANQAAAGNQDFSRLFKEQAAGSITGIEGDVKDAGSQASGREAANKRTYDKLINDVDSIWNKSGIGNFGPGRVSTISSYINMLPLDGAAKTQLLDVVENSNRTGVNPAAAIRNLLSGYTDATGDITSEAQRAQLSALARLAGQKDPRAFGESYQAGAAQFNADKAAPISSLLSSISSVPYGKSTLNQIVTSSGPLRAEYLNQFLTPAEKDTLNRIRSGVADGSVDSEVYRTMSNRYSDSVRAKVQDHLKKITDFEGGNY